MRLFLLPSLLLLDLETPLLLDPGFLEERGHDNAVIQVQVQVLPLV
jgi:hypothetical protein